MSLNTFLVSLAIISFGYLTGSIPSAYLAGKLIKGIDLRNYGSGTVSGSMVWEHVSRWPFILVTFTDIFKGVLPTWLGVKLGAGLMVATIVGLAAVAGHNWPVYLNFTGGRGLSPFVGMLLVLFPWGFPWMVIFLAVGYFLGDSAPWALMSLITMSFPVRWLGESAIISWSALAMMIITLVKRLEANGRPLPIDGGERRRTIWLRLIFDRDILPHKEWIRRKPTGQ